MPLRYNNLPEARLLGFQLTRPPLWRGLLLMAICYGGSALLLWVAKSLSVPLLIVGWALWAIISTAWIYEARGGQRRIWGSGHWDREAQTVRWEGSTPFEGSVDHVDMRRGATLSRWVITLAPLIILILLMLYTKKPPVAIWAEIQAGLTAVINWAAPMYHLVIRATGPSGHIRIFVTQIDAAS